MLTDAPNNIVKCSIYHENYGSDHRATYLEWNQSTATQPEHAPRRAFHRTDWEKVGLSARNSVNLDRSIDSAARLDDVAQALISATSAAVERHTPLMRPSPYSKRWFTPELKSQQSETNKARRLWQTSCASRGPLDDTTQELFRDMKRRRREWTRAIEKAKANHWKEFLDNARCNTTLWKAATFMKPRDAFANIPPLVVDDVELRDNESKARVLLESFFPRMAEAQHKEVEQAKEELPWLEISEEEIEKALKAAKPNKTPGKDGLPMLVWKKLWPHVSSIIEKIFNASITLGHYPCIWKTASIIAIRKPGKADYTLPRSYRPISLLNTLGKLLESVIARRLTYWAEAHHLLPETQFGGRPGRTTEQALLILANAVNRAWAKNKMVTLVAFDLKNAFNGVNSRALDIVLQQKGIPAAARSWIRSFMEDRMASLKFDDFETDTTPLEYAGLAQGSPLSPILFTFFNSDLVDQPVNFKGGASAFIDDYFRWRVGRTSQENIQKIQQDDISRVEEWAKRTGCCFATDKTELIHLTRKKKELGQGTITMCGTSIQAAKTAKLLGVVFNQELRWKDHVQKAIQRATRAVSAMSGLRHLRPAQMRQLYQACVAPVVDYASTVWHNPQKDVMHLRALGPVQREALVRTLSAFKTVATQTLEVEAFVPPTRLRLKQRSQNAVTNLYTSPHDHPIQSVLARAERCAVAKGTMARLPLVHILNTMDLVRTRQIEKIDPRPIKPWSSVKLDWVHIAEDAVTAIQQHKEYIKGTTLLVYLDALVRRLGVGVAAVILNKEGRHKHVWQSGIGPKQDWSVPVAELIAIHGAINLIMEERKTRADELTSSDTDYAVATDSKAALRAIMQRKPKSGQDVVCKIHDLVSTLQTEGHTSLRLIWIPAHSDIFGNSEADRLAKEAVGKPPDHSFHALLSSRKKAQQQDMIKEWRQEWESSKVGAHLKTIDEGLPSKRVLRLRGNMNRQQTFYFTQLRSGHSWLQVNAKLRGFSVDDKCKCGARETVVHVLVHCPLLRDLRKEMRSRIGDSFNSVARMLGGSGTNRQGNAGRWPINKEVIEAVIDFATASQRFCSRAARPNFQASRSQRR